MYNYRNQLSDVDIYPSRFHFWIFCSTLCVGEDGGEGGLEPRENTVEGYGGREKEGYQGGGDSQREKEGEEIGWN